MIGAELGPYRITAELGRGGMGQVWAAELTRPAAGLDAGHRVALKILHPHLLESEGFFKRFLLEAEIGKSVRHRNVVRTFDADAILYEGSQRNFLVMELVEGQTLRELLAELGLVPEELCRHVAGETAKGLAAIHAAGVVHRDLKPDNVLITPDHAVKVMDLGVARLVDEAIRLSQTGAFIGSLMYAAPEQFRGVNVDSRADLYALGLVLYELSTGESPYPDADFESVIHGALSVEPRRLGEASPQISPFFEELIHSMLVKDPAERLGPAEVVAQLLEDGEDSEWWRRRSRDIRKESKRPLRRVRIPRESAVYGRDEEIGTLRETFHRAKAGAGQVVLIEGEAGIGKTRLVDELVAGLRNDGEDLNFLFGSYPPSGAATAAGAWSTAYREQFGEDGLERTLEGYLADTPLLIPAFAALLRGSAPPEGAAPLAGDPLQTVFVHSTRKLAAERPTIVLIDDLHFAPEGGRDLFAALALAIPGHRVLLIGTSRRGLPEKWTSELDRLQHVNRLTLERLCPSDLAKLLLEVLRSVTLAEDLTGKIAMKSDGNPFFVFEIIRGLREDRLLTRGDDGSWVTTRQIREIQVPSTVLELIRARVAELTEDERSLLEVASCCGYEFDPSLVAKALGEPVLPTLKQFARIEYGHQLIRSAGRRYRFDHHQVQESLYAGLFAQLREQYHAALGEALQSRVAGTAAGADAVLLCEHFFKGASPERALPHLPAALDHLEGGYLNDAAADLAGRALAVPDLLEGEDRIALLVRRERRLNDLGRREEQRAALEEALAIGGERASLLAALGHLLHDQAERREADAVLRRAIALAMKDGDLRSEITARRTLGHSLRAEGKSQEGLQEYERTKDLAEALGDERELAFSAGSIGLAMNALGRYEEALEWYRKDLEVAIRQGNRRSEAVCLGNLGTTLEHLGRLEEARDHHERCLTISREVGYRRSEVIAMFNLAGLHESLGFHELAIEIYDRCLLLAEEIGYRLASAAVPGNVAILRRGQGRLGEAVQQSEKQLEISREIEYPQGQAIALENLGSMRLALGDSPGARDLAEDALAVTREIGARRVETYALEVLGDVDAEEGNADAARRRYGEVIEMRREMSYEIGLAGTLLALGRLEAREGRTAEALACFEESLDLAKAHDAAETLVLATCHLAALTSQDHAAAREVLESRGDRLDHLIAMEARFTLWRATGDKSHLQHAHALLMDLRTHAPKAYRGSMIENVFLYREIAAAAKDHLASRCSRPAPPAADRQGDRPT